MRIICDDYKKVHFYDYAYTIQRERISSRNDHIIANEYGHEILESGCLYRAYISFTAHVVFL